jgi:tetratricopeptide (TPR) repeat protein
MRYPRNARLPAGVLVLFLLLAGCGATPPLPAGFEPRRVELAAVPYFAQGDFQCGPATLAMVLNHQGIALTPEQLAPGVYLPGREGSLQIELVSAARRQQRLAYVIEPRLDALLAELAAGRPLIVLQNLGFDWLPRWHYAVAIGYDLERGELLLRSGPERRQQLSLRTFDLTWARGGRWALLLLPPGEMPATAEPVRYLAAAHDLEQTGQLAAALTAYAAAATRWPEQLAASIGAGNCAYRLGDLATAEYHFRTASEHHPLAAAAFNNLADTLLQRGRRDEALAAARRAVAIGAEQNEPAAQRAIYAATLREIEQSGE